MTFRRRRWLPYLLFLLLVGIAMGWQLVKNPAHEERDIIQERLDKASEPLVPGHVVGQTFLSRHRALKAVEFLLVLYQPEREIPPSARIALTLTSLDDPAAPPVAAEMSVAGLEHNQRIRFAFPQLLGSQGTPYRLTLSVNEDHGIGFWHTTTDAYAYGEMLVDGRKTEGDLYFITLYDYHLSDVLADAARALGRCALTMPALLLLLFLPGLVLSLYFLPRGRLDAGTFVGVVLGLSMATWPLLLLWATLFRVNLSGWPVWLFVGLLLASGTYRAWSKRGQPLLRENGPDEVNLPEIGLAAVLFVALATRLIQVRELVVPNWVDSLHHTLITQLISDRGMVPSSLEPYLPVGDFHYHFGFHANAAVLTWLSGLPSHQAVLLLGQVLNAAAALAGYALAWGWTRRRWAGVAAALVIGAISYMPAYYASWGRFTQLGGLILLPPAVLATSWLFAPERRACGLWVVATVLVAGLALTHYRVMVFYALSWIPYALLWLVRQRGSRSAWGLLAKTAVILGLLALTATLPWAVRFSSRILPRVKSLYGGWGASEALDTSFPWGLLEVGWTRVLLYLAGAGTVWGILRRNGEMILIPVWVGLWLLVANLHLLGIPNVWLVHNQSVVISFWLPVSVLCGWLAGDAATLLARGVWLLTGRLEFVRALSWGLLGATFAMVGWGSWRMVDTINPITTVATPDDLRAMEWARENLPPQARVLINTRPWQGELRVGNDGGYWLPILGQREATLPCVLYYQGTPAYREAVNDLARAVEVAETLDEPGLRERLAKEGVTHVFVGSKGGRMMPKDLDASPYYRLRYATGPTRIYEFVPEGG